MRNALIISTMFVFAFSFVFLGFSSAYSAGLAPVGPPRVTLRLFNISPGKSDRVTGINFTPNSAVSITFAGANNVVAKTGANSTGGFVTQFIVPSGTPQGLYPVVATDNSSAKLSAQNILNVVLVAKIVLSTAGKAHVVGGTVYVNGTGFAASRSVTIYFNNLKIGSSTTDGSGNFLTTFSLPSDPFGSYYVNATDGTNNVGKLFALSSHLVISPNTKTTVGSPVAITGSGYSANSQVSFTFGGSAVATKVTSKSDGSFSVQITIPNVPKGGYQVVGTDSNGHSAKGRVGVLN